MADMDYDIFCFDVDSTLISLEGIDRLAELRGDATAAAISKMTTDAMNGTAKVPFHEMYRRRLEMINPTRGEVLNLADYCLNHFTEGTRETVNDLLEKDRKIFLVSGGIGQVVGRIANELGVTAWFGVPLYFDQDDNYIGFDDSVPTCKDDGKTDVVRRIKELNPGKRIVFVGDGNTDLTTKCVVDYFIAYTGVVRRESVAKGADMVIDSMYKLPR